MNKGFKNPNTQKWFVAYTISTDIFHFGKVEASNEMITGQETMERFGSEQALAARTNVIKGVPNWYEDNVIND